MESVRDSSNRLDREGVAMAYIIMGVISEGQGYYSASIPDGGGGGGGGYVYVVQITHSLQKPKKNS